MTKNEFHGLRPADLDDFDRQLIRLLQEDGRQPVAEMARSVGLSHAAVRQRVQRLLAERIVTISATTHPQTHGYTESALLGIRTDARVTEVSEAIAAIDEAYYVVSTHGRYDLIVELMARDRVHLLELVMRIRALEGVVSTETMSFVETVKWVYRPQFPAEAADPSPAP
jgi:Lrp/AsnC family transcriptional regulator for asnA, asnC and gidA